MRWTVETLDPVDAEIEALPPAMQARLIRLMEAIENVGLEQLGESHVKHVEGKLWEIRAKSAEGIARALYVTSTGRARRHPARLRQEDPEDAARSPFDRQSAHETGVGT